MRAVATIRSIQPARDDQARHHRSARCTNLGPMSAALVLHGGAGIWPEELREEAAAAIQRCADTVEPLFPHPFTMLARRPT